VTGISSLNVQGARRPQLKVIKKANARRPKKTQPCQIKRKGPKAYPELEKAVEAAPAVFTKL